MGNKAVLAGCLAKSFHKESRIAESDDRPTIAVNEIHSKDYDKISLEMVQIVTIDETTIQSSVFNNTEMSSLSPSRHCSCLIQKQMEVKADIHTCGNYRPIC